MAEFKKKKVEFNTIAAEHSEKCFNDLGTLFTDSICFFPTARPCAISGADATYFNMNGNGSGAGGCEVKAILEGKFLLRDNNKDRNTGEISEHGTIELEMWVGKEDSDKYGWLYEYTHPTMFNKDQYDKRLQILREYMPGREWTPEEIRSLSKIDPPISEKDRKALYYKFQANSAVTSARTPKTFVQMLYSDHTAEPESLIAVIVFEDFPKLVKRLNKINGGRWNIGLEKDKEPDKSTWHYLSRKEFNRIKTRDFHKNMWYVPLDQVADLARVTLTNTARGKFKFFDDKNRQFFLTAEQRDRAGKRYNYLREIASGSIPDVPAELERISRKEKEHNSKVYLFNMDKT